MFDEVKKIIGDTLQLQDRVDSLRPETHLLGNLPELDSMAVVTIITTIEDYFGFIVDDDEITAETFDTLGSLVNFVEHKIDDE